MNKETFVFFEVADTFCKRPKMYTLNGTFGEVVAAIDSYAQDAYIFRKRCHHALDPFHRFLSGKPQFESVGDFVGWGDFWNAYQDDETAIRELRKYLEEFRQTLSEVEGFGIDIWIEESEAEILYSYLSKLAKNESKDEEIISKIKESLKSKLEILQWQKEDFYKTEKI